MSIIEEALAAHGHLTGWTSKQKAEVLVSAIIALRPQFSLEIGVWGGKGCIPMAIAHKRIGVGKVIGVDPWMASSSVEGQVNEEDRKWWSDQKNHDLVYNMFMSSRKAFGLDDYLQVVRSSSDDFTPPELGLLVIDGNHGEQAITDTQRYAPHVNNGGLVVMDDLNWSGGAVSRAVNELLKMGFIELYRVENKSECWAVFQRL